MPVDHVGALYAFEKLLAREARYNRLRKELAMDVCDMLDSIDTLQRATGISEGQHDAPAMEETKTYLMPFTTVPTPSTALFISGSLRLVRLNPANTENHCASTIQAVRERRKDYRGNASRL